jgi:5-methylcytosine-specific restriction endonuclease McrA
VILKPCLEEVEGRLCGALTPDSRCAIHRRARERYRGSSSARGYDGAWRRLRRAVVDEWVLAHGHVCPGYRCPQHPSTDLTGDHVVGIAQGGQSVRSNAGVLCRACNAAKSNDQRAGRVGGDRSTRNDRECPRPESHSPRVNFPKESSHIFIR